MGVQEKEQLWGGETTKAVANFPVSGETVPVPVVRWLGRIKGAAARVNCELGLLDAYPRIAVPVLLLWAEDDQSFPLEGAQEALDLLPRGQLRTLPGTGFLMAYDDPVGVARELIAFCG